MKLSFIPVFKNVFIFIIAAQHYRSLVKPRDPHPENAQDYDKDTYIQKCQSTIVKRDLNNEVLYCVTGKLNN